MTFDLTGTLLISTPAMGDPRFAHSVIYLCAHGSEGAFGLVLNRPLKRLRLAEVLGQLSIPVDRMNPATPVLAGGPVETQRGFVLHSGDGDANAPVSGGGPKGQALPGGLVLSASTEVLRALAAGRGPRQWLLLLGYSGWGPGQLEAEIGQNAWLTCAAPNALIFDPAPGDHQWSDALRSMGVDPITLSAVAGRA